ncbi:unnamed protein product [Pedinophyceae sp. YPF-701]|nr:unnamed protein product [Pedinophyceae sp. YPF-701]
MEARESAQELVRLTPQQATRCATLLCDVKDLPLPEGLVHGNLSKEALLKILQELALSDPGLFLERFWRHLPAEGIEAFWALREDCPKVDHYTNEWARHHTAAQREAAPSQQQPPPAKRGKVPAAVRNRRLAAMRRLARDEGYFTEEAMRQRCPLLHHYYVGQYAGDANGGGVGAPPRNAAARRPGEPLGAALMRQQDEAATMQRMARERAVELAREQMEVESESDDEGADAEGPRAPATPPGRGGGVRGRREEAEDAGPVSEEERALLRGEFEDLMRLRFLSGEDAEFVDYGAIDDPGGDASLGSEVEDFAERDAEDAYFGE